MSNFEKRVQINKIIESQLPEFVVSDFTKATEFFKQYYISQEFQGGTVDIVENLDQYLKLDNLVPEVIIGKTTLTSDVSSSAGIVTVTSTKGFPSEYGLLKINDEIITYTGITTNTFTGCVRGFSGITGYTVGVSTFVENINKQSLTFSSSAKQSHTKNATVQNLSVLFLQEFYKKLKYTFTPGLENYNFTSDLNVGNFVKHARNFYQSKGIEESVKILFKVLYGVDAEVIDLESRLIKPSSANYIRREVIVAQRISGDPYKLEGQTIFKSTNLSTNASVSNVEIFTRNNLAYYRLELFVGYDDRDLIEGIFTVPGKTKVLETVSVGSSIISVDSTIGFGQTGTIISGNNKINYESKSINQFFKCTGVSEQIPITSDIRSDELIFGYENGDQTKKVELRITGTPSNLVEIDNINNTQDGEEIRVKNLGEEILNPSSKTYKETFANSWIYNTSTRYQVSSISGSTFTLLSEIDKASLKSGDIVDIVLRNTSTIVSANAIVNSINSSLKQVTLNNISGFSAVSSLTYDIRRKVKKAKSFNTPIIDGNEKYISDTLNVYTDGDIDGYIASNSLPSYEIVDEIVEHSIPNGTVTYLDGYDSTALAYSIIKFSSNVRFIDGDIVVYRASNPLPGLESGTDYYVILTAPNQIRLYQSISSLSGPNYVQFKSTSSAGNHLFTLKSNENRVISPNLILRKFPLSQEFLKKGKKIDLRKSTSNVLGSIGILIDGVEISRPDSDDKVYYGPLKKFEILNGGRDYDVVNPPQISISSGLGVTALVEPIISGIVTAVYVDPQDFDIEKVSLSLTGGNGSGCILEPIFGERFRELEFDSRALSLGGGVDITTETITFLTNHKFSDGERIIYFSNGNTPISIGNFGDSTNAITGTLVNGDEYIAKFVNTSTIKLHNSISDYRAGINTIGFSTTTQVSGIHKFRTISKNTLKKIKVINGGSGYQHRKLRVTSSGISTEYHTITFENHGFLDGDIVTYFSNNPIVGLSTANRYSINLLDNNSFRLINLGIGATLTSDLIRKKHVKLGSIGSEYHIFQYPPIQVNVNVSFGSSLTGQFTFTPIVTGKIIDAYLYETGTGYGSNILNLHKKPLVTLKNGKKSQLNPIITNGRISGVQVLSGGTEYFSIPTLKASGNGTGAILRPVINNGIITNVIVINSGIGYSSTNTSIEVIPSGFGAKFDTQVRDLTVNDTERYSTAARSRTTKIFSSLRKNTVDNSISYGIYGYSADLASNYSDSGTLHSPIIGWAYDGNPIYGPYGYITPTNIQSGIKILRPGYSLDITKVQDRPSSFSAGFFIEDYSFDGSGDLDKHNGRFCITPEFPKGVYAYFAGVTTSLTSNTIEPLYPYFVGDSFKSEFIQENGYLKQNYDFNNSNLVRNTFPYKVNDRDANYDFFVEPYEFSPQNVEVKSIKSGAVTNINILDGGRNYKIGDVVNFNQRESGGSGLRVTVSELTGKHIKNIETTNITYSPCVFVWDSDTQVSGYYLPGFNDLRNGDLVNISGLSTSISNLSGSKIVGFSSESVALAATMSSYSAMVGGTVQDILISSIPTVSIGGSIFISSPLGNETIKVLNNYGNGVLRIQRFANSGVAHTFGTRIFVTNDRIKIPVNTREFESKTNKLVYFNTKDSVGVGTTAGGAQQKSVTISGVTKTVSVPFRNIHLPNHPFKTGERLTFTKSQKAGVDSLIVGNDDTALGTFQIPNIVTYTSDVYVINKGRDYIGLATQVGLTTLTEGLYFYSDGSNNSEYLLEMNYKKVTGSVDRIVSTISLGQTHGLSTNDTIKLTVIPNTIVGLGSTSPVSVSFDEINKSLLINSVGINSTQINLVDNTFTFSNHGYKTGDKVYYSSIEVASGLTTGFYHIIKESDNKFKLSETLYESNESNQIIVNIVGTGGTHHVFALVNPKIDVVKNSTLTFNLENSSLRGYKLKIFSDKEFKKEFISSFDSNTFNVVGFGTVGFGTASLSLKYSSSIPLKLYYGLEKSGYISTADKEVTNYSEINFVDSEYNGTYNIFGISSDSFKISPSKTPSILKYADNQVSTLKYSVKKTDSADGPIEKVVIISPGFDFKKSPKFIDVTSVNGKDANIIAISTSIGKIKQIEFKDIGYEYPSDKTLKPEAFVSPIVNLENSDSIQNINIVYGGERYLTPPSLILWNETTKKVIDSQSFNVFTPNGSISKIEQIAPIFGLKSNPHKLIAINNSNTVGISSIITGNSGIATCTLKTPVLSGLPAGIFNNGDDIFVEGIDLIPGSSGSGYNSSNYDYRFFKVQSFVNSNPAILTFAIVDELGVGLSTNPGIAKTFQSGYAGIVNKKFYPILDVIKKRSEFLVGEQLEVNLGNGFIKVDCFISRSEKNYIKVKGKYELLPGNKIRGLQSGSVGDISSIQNNKSKFNINYAVRQNFGWQDDIGKLSEDYQVTPDNNYYQNLSYSIKSPITWENLSTPVNSVIHPSGLKNFADVGIVSFTKSSVGFSGTTTSLVILDVFEEKKVYTINNFDNAVDFDIRTNPTQSKFLKIQNRKLTDYTQCRTNRVLIHDDISNRFSSKGSEDAFVEIDEINFVDKHIKYLIQVLDPDTFDSQLTEIVLQTTSNDSFLFEKYSSFTKELLGEFDADVDDSGRKTLRFSPTDIFDRDHDIKILKKTFLSENPGIGTQTIGSVKLIGSNVIGVSSVGTANSIRTIAGFAATTFNGLFANLEIANTTTNEINYVEAALDFDGSNTYLSEYYFNNQKSTSSSNSIGILTSVYDSSVGIVSFMIRNDTSDVLNVRSNIVSFASTASGIGTYRFLFSGQPEETERSVILESKVGFGTTSITLGSYDVNTFTSASSIVRISLGSSLALHQVSILQNKVNVTVVPGPFSPSNNTTGLGTFGGEIIGNKFNLNFYPDSTSGIVTAQAFNEVFYTETDFDNLPQALVYETVDQKVFATSYDGKNGTRVNKVSFDLKHNNVPIYKKTFNPANSSILNLSTGLFTITNHFFNTGEELVYTPGSSFIGIGKTAVGIGSTVNHLGVVTNRLPEKVFAIVITPDTFKLATTQSFAASGIAVTFTDVGVGNIHSLEMTKKLSKTVIALDGVVQQPITFTPVNHKLQYNSGGITSGISTFNLSGISSIQPRDILKIDDEYMKVVEVGISSNVGGALLGPIRGIIQAGSSGITTFPTVSVVRASIGSTATAHSDGANVQLYKGSFNIVGSEVYFTDPPKGNTRRRRDQSNLPYVKAEFSGRTFLRSNYATNMVFDDISSQFTGIGQTYRMTVEGINTTGVSIGNGILFINGVFQTPSTLNNAGNNYEFQSSSGISSVVFTGITSTDGSYIRSDFDINQNQLPRGGIIVSLGSTPGLGYAPLVGAKVKANLNASGSITSITGISHTGPGQSISTALYNNITGIIEITTNSNHNFGGGDRIKLVGLAFTCPSSAGIISYFPSTGLDYSYDIVGIISAKSFTANVGTSTLPHTYIGFGTVFPWYDLNHGSGYRGTVSIGVTDPNHVGSEASITATVGAGGTLSFNVVSGGTGYNDPYIRIPEPNYENLSVVGVSRVGIGSTTSTGSNLLMNIKIGPASGKVGVGSTSSGISYDINPGSELQRRLRTPVNQNDYIVGAGASLFQVESFQIARPGYAFQVGDVFKPIGLVTAIGYNEPITEFELEVVETFNDSISSWSFGEMNFIDSISLLQDGSRTRFPLFLNGQLLSFEIDASNALSSAINLDAVLIIFVNGVLQTPGVAYQFNGGTSFIFTEAPDAGDDVDIFFYLGQNGVDISVININETVKIGDLVRVYEHPLHVLTSNQDRGRTVTELSGSDTVETDIYTGPGINDSIFHPFEWTKQKKDLYVGGIFISKNRDSLEPFVYPTAKIIGNISSSDTAIFVDDARFFIMEETTQRPGIAGTIIGAKNANLDFSYGINISTIDARIVEGTNPVSAAFTATVSVAGTISAITITNPGLGYSSNLPIKISAPPIIGVGIGTTAAAQAIISGGIVSSVLITNPGFGYSIAPQVIIDIPKAKTEYINGIPDNGIQGFAGIITGISTTSGIGGHPLALKINFRADASDANDLQPGYPIFVYETVVGSGLTSVNSENASIVGIGTNHLDNIYIVGTKTNTGPDCEIICNIHTNTNTTGINTVGSILSPRGKVSWGRITNFTSRVNPISIGVTGLTIDAGLSSLPEIQRREFGLRDSGGIRKFSNNSIPSV